MPSPSAGTVLLALALCALLEDGEPWAGGGGRGGALCAPPRGCLPRRGDASAPPRLGEWG